MSSKRADTVYLDILDTPFPLPCPPFLCDTPIPVPLDAEVFFVSFFLPLFPASLASAAFCLHSKFIDIKQVFPGVNRTKILVDLGAVNIPVHDNMVLGCLHLSLWLYLRRSASDFVILKPGLSWRLITCSAF